MLIKKKLLVAALHICDDGSKTHKQEIHIDEGIHQQNYFYSNYINITKKSPLQEGSSGAGHRTKKLWGKRRRKNHWQCYGHGTRKIRKHKYQYQMYNINKGLNY